MWSGQGRLDGVGAGWVWLRCLAGGGVGAGVEGWFVVCGHGFPGLWDGCGVVGGLVVITRPVDHH